MSYKLLLADDSVTIQRVVALSFAHEDVCVIAVGDGEEAIAHVQTDRPDIVLVDIGVPKRSGYDVAAFIKHDAALSHIPVLLLAGAFEPIDDEQVRRAGCDGVLVKPFEPRHMIARVRELLHLHDSPRSMPSMSHAPPALDQHASSSSSLPNTSVGQPVPTLPSEARTARALEDFYNRLAAASAGRESPAGADPTSRPILAKTTVDALPPLRALEQGEPGGLSPRLTAGEACVEVNDDLIDRIVTRVIERLAPDVVHDVVVGMTSEMAERLMREEFERARKRT